MNTFIRSIYLVPLLLMAGCESLPNVEEVLPDKKVEYKKSRQAQHNLEVPPDLTRDSIDSTLAVPDISPSGSATYSDYKAERKPGVVAQRPTSGRVLPKIQNVQIKRDGNKRWLTINAHPEDVWTMVLSFWQENGILLLEQDPEVGVMRTSWLENRADIKSDFITDAIRKVFDGVYSSGTRDQFRVRLEQGAKEDSTELYLTHRGMEEKIMTGSTNQGEQSVWVSRPSDEGLEAVMLRRLMMHLGVAENRAKELVGTKAAAKKQARAARAVLQKSRDVVALRINEDMDRSWRLTGMALDRVGFAVEDRNRQESVYYVRYNDPYADQKDKEGLLSKLAFWSDEEKIDKAKQYQVRLNSAGEQTEVAVYNDQNNRDNSPTAARILTLLHEQIR